MWIKLSDGDNIVYVDTSYVRMITSIPDQPKQSRIYVAEIGPFIIPHSPEETAKSLGIPIRK